MLATSTTLLGDLSGFRTLLKDSESLIQEFTMSRQDQFSDWSNDVQSQIDDTHHPLWLVG